VKTGPEKSDGRTRLVLFEGNKKLFTASTALIRRNNIGQAISLGFIRITNEDVIDQTPR
jgi:hypothetical protein